MTGSREGRTARFPRWSLIAVTLLAALPLAVAAGVRDRFTLYRIPHEDGKRAHYTDRRPPKGVRYREVGDYERTSRPVNLLGGRRKVVVYYPKGEKRTGQSICEDAWYAVRLNERIAGFPFSWPGDVKIYRVPESEIGSAGQHRGREGILVSGSHEYLMYHEISHYWVNTDLYRERWLAEGFAELHAYIVGRRVRGYRSGETFRAWKFKAIRDYAKPDFPLETWTFGQKSTLGRERFAYGKAFAACSLLMDRFGLYRLQQVNRIIRRRRKPVTTREYIGLLEGVVRRGNVGEVLSGWVLTGRYRLKGKPVSLPEYLRYLDTHPPAIPGKLDPARPDVVHPRTRPASTTKPTGFFLDEHGNPIKTPDR